MNTTGNRAFVFVDLEELLDFSENVFKITGFETAGALLDIAMHRVTAPDDIFAFTLHFLEQCREILFDLVSTHTHDKIESTLFILWIERIDQLDQFILLHTWADFAPDRVFDSAEIFDMRTVKLSRPVANPEHMRRTVIPVIGNAVLAR